MCIRDSEITIYLRVKNTGAEIKATPGDTLDLSGIRLRLKNALTDEDTNRTPRSLRVTASIAGTLQLYRIGPISINSPTSEAPAYLSLLHICPLKKMWV